MARSLEQKREEVRDRACSKILWGERDDDVFRFLKGEGLQDQEIETMMAEAHRERAVTIRQRSLGKVALGIIGVIGSVAGLIGAGLLVDPIGLGLSGIIFFASVPFTYKSIRDLISGKTRGSALID